jgi:hypothetical protein
VSVGPISAVADVVAPAVLITVGGLLVNGILLAWSQLAQRLLDLTHERAGILRGSRGEGLGATGTAGADLERIAEIEQEVSITSKRLVGLRRVAVTLELAIGILVLALISVGTAVVAHSSVIGYLAMSLMFLGTVMEFAGVALITSQAMHGDTAAQYAARRVGHEMPLSRASARGPGMPRED